MPMPLPQELKALHQSLGARFEGETIAGYASAEAEDAALRTSCGLFDRSDRGKLRLTGTERASFLHGLVTNEVKSLAPGAGVYCALLTPKGHMVADARVLVRRDELLLDTEPGREAAVREFLEKHLVSEDVEVSDRTAPFALLSLLGPASAEVVSATLGGTRPHLDEHQHLEREDLLVVGTRLGALTGLDLFVPMARACAVTGALLERGKPLCLAPVGARAVEILRVEAGVPRFGAEMGEETIPLEANLGERAISFTKGCYIGQEVIARASYRGGVRRRLVGLRLESGAMPGRGASLVRAPGETKPAGELATAVVSPRLGAIALGYARREFQAPGTELFAADGARLRVCALPFA